MNQVRWWAMTVLLVLSSGIGCSTRLSRVTSGAGGLRRISVDSYVDKVKAGWVGQMVGTGWSEAIGDRYPGVIVPQSDVPQWSPRLVNQFDADNLCVEMTFLRTLEIFGVDVSSRQAGIEFASSRYELDHGALAARENLRNGIAPPDSGHPQFNPHAGDLDYQASAGFSGLIAPGMANVPVLLGEKFGRLMAYGDGLYGGQFIGAMYAEAFFETDMTDVVKAALQYIPAESLYHQCIADVLRWHKRYPKDWTRTWHLLDERYHLDPSRRKFSCTGPTAELDLSAHLNGAYVVMALLYGQGDPERTTVIAMRCGQDARSNAANAAGILFASIGFAGLPEEFTIALDPLTEFSGSFYGFPALIGVCDELTRKIVLNDGGRIEQDSDGNAFYAIRSGRVRSSGLEEAWLPGRAQGSRFTEEEMAAITAPIGEDLSEAIEQFAPGWSVAKCGRGPLVGLVPQLRGRRNVLVTRPLSQEVGCVISRIVQLPADPSCTLRLVVGHDARGDWDLILRIDGRQLLRKSIGLESTMAGWTEISVDLSRYAGETIKIELINEATGWHYEAAYWGEISLDINR